MDWSKQPIKEQILDFYVLGSKFVKFLLSILKWQVNSSSHHVSFFIVMIHNSPVNFKLTHFLIWIKDPIKVTILTLLSALVKICQISHVIFWNYKSLFLKILHHSLMSWKMTPLYFFSSSIICFGQRSHLKCKFFRLSSAQVKIRQIRHVNLKTTRQFLFNFCVILHCHGT